MTETIYDRINRTLSWRRVITFNVGLFLVMIIPLSVQLAQQDTENRSGAAGEVEMPVVTPPPNYPVEAPRLDRVTMFFGKRGDTIVLLGNNFGDYQWGSSVYVGNALASTDNIVRWSNSVIEVKIPESARSGRVWVIVNGRESAWDGSLLLYENSLSAKVGLNRVGTNQAEFVLSNAPSANAGMVELGYVAEPLDIVGVGGVVVESMTPGADVLGRKTTIRFRISNPSSAETPILNINHPGIGVVELVRVELYDADGLLLPLYADPLAMKVLP